MTPRSIARTVRRISVLAPLALATACASDPPSDAPATIEAGTARAEIRPFDVTLDVLATVTARPGGRAAVSAPAATRVSRVRVATGDSVANGQPLIELDAEVFRAQERQAQAAFDAAQAAFDRAHGLVTQGISPRRDEEDAAAALAQARTQLADARRTLSLAVLRAPLRGIVIGVHATLAQPVEANQTLVEIVDPGALEVVFHLSPEQAAWVSPGARVELAGVTGTIAGVSAAVDSVTGTVTARARIDPMGTLRLGQTVDGRIVIARHENAVVVPAAALVPDEKGTHVFVVDADGTAHATAVQVGARTGEEVEILSGLDGGERVVREGAYGVLDGARIRSGGT